MKHANKSIAALAAAGLLAAPLVHADGHMPTVYGKISVSFAAVDDDTGNATAIESHASRFGVKGSVPASDDLAVTYQLEWQVEPTEDDKGNATQDNIKSRDQFVGLKGSFGSVKLGRLSLPYKNSGSKVDLFGDEYADAQNILAKNEDKREGDTIEYSNAIGPVDFAVAYSTQVDTTAAENNATVASGHIGYNGIKNLNLAFAYQATEAGDDATKFSVLYKWEKVTFGANFELVDDTANNDETNWLLSVNIPVSDAGSVQLQAGAKDVDNSTLDPTLVAAKYTHAIGKVKVYGFAASGSEGGMSANTPSSMSAGNGDSSAFGAGLVFSF